MKRLLPLLAAACTALAGGPVAPAHAVPPIATPSPGYDARLQESRKATTTTVTPVQPKKKPRKAPPQ
jgi:hypothetical protein